MNKIAVVYWSMTGNTEAMARAVAAGAQGAGADAELIEASGFGPEKLADYSAIAFGCPAMGDEVLEEEVFDPMFTACEPQLSGKKIALFGSYDWGDGEWMRLWDERCRTAGAVIACDFVICNLEPDEDGTAACEQLGAALA